MECQLRWYVCGLLLSAALVGCSQAPPKLELFPAHGQVTFQKKPVANAKLRFFGLDEALQGPHAPFPTAITDESGEFVIRSYADEVGAPAGKYQVTLVCRMSDSLDPERRDDAEDLFGGKYEDPGKTPLIVEIAPGDNELHDFEF